VAPLLDFYKLLLEEKLDLSKMNLKLPQYDVLQYKPLLKGMNYNSVEDILLMHTYAEDKTQQEVRAIYSSLLNSSKIATDIMHYTAINLIKGDDLKILFISNFTGGYMPLQNIIGIGEMGEKLTPAAITIHELGHYVLFNAFPNSQGTPFDLSKINLLGTTQNDIYGYHFNKGQEQKGTFFKEAHSDLDKFLRYEQGAKQVFVKAGELLGLNSAAFEPYVLSKDFMLFFKDNSFIDLFMDNFEASWGPQLKDLPLSRKKVFLNAYFSHLQEEFEDDSFSIQGESGDTCPNALPHIKVEVKFQDIEKFAQEQYFPAIIKKFDLNEDKIWFLERIADVLNRAKDVYDCPASYAAEDCNYGAYYQELIVRYAELKIAGIEQELLDAFSGLVAAWEEDVAPIIEQARADFLSQQELLDFSYHI
jgi:hypothetical protein